MNIEQNLERLRRINDDSLIQNLIAQANARYILLNTSESHENFPAYTIKDSNLNILSFYYLEIGCSFAENPELLIEPGHGELICRRCRFDSAYWARQPCAPGHKPAAARAKQFRPRRSPPSHNRPIRW